jgi:hypothetical protein
MALATKRSSRLPSATSSNTGLPTGQHCCPHRCCLQGAELLGGLPAS